ncbi:MAG: amidohydrolase [Pseudomonadota bacterium]
MTTRLGMLLTTVLLGSALTMAACSKTTEPGATHIFVNAKVYTMNTAAPEAEALVVQDDLISFVGSSAEAKKFAGTATQVHDMQGGFLLPGFIDTHVHPVAGGAYAKALSLDTFGTVEQWVDAIEEYAAQNPDKPVLFGYGFLATTFGTTGPLKDMIDKVVLDRPVLIMDEGFHGAWANSAALKALNITADTQDPTPGFSYYKRDANGEATGYLLEETAGMAMDALDVITEEVIIDGTAFVIDTMNAYGVTAAFDAGAMATGDTVLSVLQQLEKRGDMSVRIIGASRPEGAAEADTAVATAMQWRDKIKGERYHYRSLKIMHDGTVEGRTAAMFEDYQGEPGNSGETVFSEEQMTAMVTGAAAQHIDLHIHALGERAIHEALNAIEIARKQHADSKTRYTICHIQVLTDADLVRFAALDVIAQSTPLWASYDTHGEQFVSTDQFNRYWRFNSLAKSGARLTFGSDFPASGAGLLGLSPVLQIEIGHTRQDPGEPDAPVQPMADEVLDIHALLRGFTIDAAYQLHMEDQIGSLEVGKKADLTVLDKNLFEVDAYDIHKTEVVLTMMDGDIVYSASD